MTDTQLIDMSVIEELLEMDDGEAGLLTDLIEMFLDDGMTHVDAIQAGLQSGDLDEVMKAAHRLKGSSGNLGLAQLSIIADRLQVAGRGGEADNASELFAELQPLFSKSSSELRHLLVTYGGANPRSY